MGKESFSIIIHLDLAASPVLFTTAWAWEMLDNFSTSTKFLGDSGFGVQEKCRWKVAGMEIPPSYILAFSRAGKLALKK